MTDKKTPVEILTSPIAVETSTHWITSDGTKHNSMKAALQANLHSTFEQAIDIDPLCGIDEEGADYSIVPGDLITWLQNNRELVEAFYEFLSTVSPSVSPLKEDPQQ